MGLRTVIQSKVGRIFNKGIELPLGAEQLHFENEEELAAFLRSRASAAAETLAAFKGMTAARLERHLARNEQLHKQVLGLLLQATESGSPVAEVWRELDISQLPDEHQWPAILFAVGANTELDESLRRLALECFVDFLRARKSLIVRLIELAREPQQTAEIRDADVLAAGKPARQPEGPAFQPLPKDKDFELRLREGEFVTLQLARWKVEIGLNKGIAEVREQGETHVLRVGETVLGRSSQCGIVLSRAPLNVSRKHLSVTWLGGDRVLLRDLSSKGTKVLQRKAS